MKAKRIKLEKVDDWYYFSSNYLTIALLACEEILKQRHTIYGRSPDSSGGPINEFTTKDLYLAIIYNVKHAIEILIKALSIAVTGEMSENLHDQKELFQSLKNKWNKEDIKKASEEAGKFLKKGLDAKDPLLKKTIEQTIENMTSVEKYFNEVEKLVEKYQNCEFIKGKIDGLFTLDDNQNTAFRYPFNSLSIELNYQKIVSKISEDDIKSIKKDIKGLEYAITNFQLLFLFYPYKINSQALSKI